MGGIREVVRERSHGQCRRRCAVHESHRAQGGTPDWSAVEEPRDLVADGTRVIKREFGKDVVWMLMVDQRLTVVGLAGLKELRKAGMRRSQRLRGKHLAKEDRAAPQGMLLHEHQPVHRLRFAGAAR